MRITFFALICFSLISKLYSQELSEFKGCIAISEEEPNITGQVYEYEGCFYLLGDYFDLSLGRWTGFVSKLDSFGRIEFIQTEKQDTIIGLQTNNKVIFSKDSLFVIGTGIGTINIMSFDLINESINVKDRFAFNELDMAIPEFDLDNVNDQYYFVGKSILNSDNAKIAKISNPTVFFEDFDSNDRSIALKMQKLLNDNLVVACNDIDSDLFYFIFLDKDLNEINSTKDQDVFFKMGKGMLVDDSGDIICTGFTQVVENGIEVYQTTVAKFNTSGDLIWIKSIDYNSGNDFANGAWNNVIESTDQNGYILIGSENRYLSNHPDSIQFIPSVAKISNEGDVLWKKNYQFRASGLKIGETFNDIIKTTDGQYFIGGVSRDFSSNGTQPWSKSIYLKISNEGEIDSFLSNNVEIENNKKILLFPNPTSNSLFIDGLNVDISVVKVFDVRSTFIDTVSFTKTNKSIYVELPQLENGIYFLLINDKEGNQYSKGFYVLK